MQHNKNGESCIFQAELSKSLWFSCKTTNEKMCPGGLSKEVSQIK